MRFRRKLLAVLRGMMHGVSFETERRHGKTLLYGARLFMLDEFKLLGQFLTVVETGYGAEMSIDLVTFPFERYQEFLDRVLGPAELVIVVPTIAHKAFRCHDVRVTAVTRTERYGNIAVLQGLKFRIAGLPEQEPYVLSFPTAEAGDFRLDPGAYQF